MAYGPGGLHRDGPIAWQRLEQVLRQDPPLPVRWIHLSGEPDREMLDGIAEVFGLHALIVDDLLVERERPRAEVFGESVYLHLRAPVGERADGPVALHSFAVVLTQDTLLTIQLGSSPPLQRVEALRERLRGGHGRIRHAGPDYLAHALIDGVVDACLDVTERVEERFEGLEDEVLGGRTGTVVARLLTLRADVLRVRRALVPLRDALRSMLADSELIRPDTIPHVRDVLDHTTQVIDRADAFRELEQGLINLVVATDSARMNETMKVLTVMSSIFIPLSFVAGVYGMNFDGGVSDLNMPELRWKYGYFLALALMGLIGGGLFAWFWRKGWIGGPKDGS